MRECKLFLPPALVLRSLIALTVLTFSAVGNNAAADDYFPFVQITCVPGLRYFAIRTFGIANTPLYFPTNRNEQEILERTYGIYTADTLARTPFDCHAPKATGSATELNAHVEMAENGCGGLRVTVNGRDVGVISAEVCGQQTEVTTTLIEATVDQDMVTIRRCDLTLSDVYPELLAHDHNPHATPANCRFWNPLDH
jgi:hypothetical protein